MTGYFQGSWEAAPGGKNFAHLWDVVDSYSQRHHSSKICEGREGYLRPADN